MMNNNSEDQIAEFLLVLASSIALYPEHVKVAVQEFGSYCTISSHATDKAILIGTRGRNSKAMSHILGQHPEMLGREARVTIEAPNTGVQEEIPIFEPDQMWNESKLKNLTHVVRKVVETIDSKAVIKVSEDNYGKTILTVIFNRNIEPNAIGALADYFKAVGKIRGREVQVEVLNENPGARGIESLSRHL